MSVLDAAGGKVTGEHTVLAVDPQHSLVHSFHPVFGACSKGWPVILNNLKTLRETGKPLPAFDFA